MRSEYGSRGLKFANRCAYHNPPGGQCIECMVLKFDPSYQFVRKRNAEVRFRWSA